MILLSYIGNQASCGCGVTVIVGLFEYTKVEHISYTTDTCALPDIRAHAQGLHI